jgi:hypothetical protein
MLVQDTYSDAKIRINEFSPASPVIHEWIAIVTKKGQPQVELAHLLVTSVEQVADYLATITISYKVLHGSQKGTGSFHGCVERQAHPHPRASLSHETPSSGGFITVTPECLQGNGIGTYMQGLVVAFVKRYPEAVIQPIKLSSEQAYGENTARRYRFYKSFGLKFHDEIMDLESGRSIPMPASELLVPETWKATITEMTIAEYVCKAQRDLSVLTNSVENLTGQLNHSRQLLAAAKKSPITWGAKTFFGNHASIFGFIFLLGLSGCIWAAFAG